ncbi:MAG: Abi family protein [Mycoplasma sp.]|nr:Abi family protein [Mycoplasma sp.]
MNKEDIKIDTYNNEYFTISEMEYVLSKRGLEIDVKNVFEKINYAYFIYEFSNMFRKEIFKNQGLKYIRGTKLSDILKLHEFSKKSSFFVFELIYEIEHLFKRNIADSISKNNAFNYLSKDGYIFKKDDNYFKNFLTKINAIHEKHIEEDELILKGKLKNNISPIWIFINSLSLGDLKKLIKYNKNFKENNIYKKMNISFKDMGNINKYRNRIAHMNPIKEKIFFKTFKGKGVIRWSNFVKSLIKLIPDAPKRVLNFWKENNKILPEQIKDEIYQKYFKYFE